MGQTGSSVHHHGQRSRSFRRVSLGALGRKHFQTNKNLSHTFTYIDEGVVKIDQLNLNTATEEELMTLPGVNRAIARNIVNHRQAIGRFNRVEDLALVSGVGAYKLELVRPEICVLTENASGRSSQASISIDSIGINNFADVNTASVFELQGIPGLNQELAANIVERRHRKGPYRSLNELARVRGIGKQRLALIKPHLQAVVDSDGSITPTPSNSTSPSLWNNPQITSTPISNGGTDPWIGREKAPKMNGINSKTHAAIKLETSSGITEEEIWELLSVASPRPLTPSDFCSKLEGRSSVRIATWNLDGFDVDKACNPGVREVICRTILENRLSLLALQEIENIDALAKLTLELNTPILKRVRDWQDNRRVWRSLHLGKGLAILWDSDVKLGISLQEQPPMETSLLPLAACASFNIKKLNITIVNMTVQSSRDKKSLEEICEYKNAVLLGDFSAINGSENLDFELSSKENTAMDPEDTFFNDNIAWGRKSRGIFSTGYSGVVKQGLTHLGIPKGWKWGGAVSNHCPVWCQVYSEPKIH